MSRAKWKGPYISSNTGITQTSQKFKEQIKNPIKTADRTSKIIPKFVGLTFKIYNGKTFLNLKVTEDMVGYKFGEFVPTRKKFNFKKK